MYNQNKYKIDQASDLLKNELFGKSNKIITQISKIQSNFFLIEFLLSSCFYPSYKLNVE